MTRRKRFDRKKKAGLRRMLAELDGLVPPGTFERDPDPFVRCAECDGLVLFSEITIGHRFPPSEKGSNDTSNLRLECDSCNQADNDYRQRMWSLLRKPEVTLCERRWLFDQEMRARALKESRIYDSVRVLDVHGETVSFTSPARASTLIRSGHVRLVEQDGSGHPTTLQLLEDRPLAYRHGSPHENLCVGCDARKYLSPIQVWPRWHPFWRGAKKSHRTAPLCKHCARAYQRTQAAVLEGFEKELPPPEERDLLEGTRLIRAALRLLRTKRPIPDPMVRKTLERTGINLAEYVTNPNRVDAVSRLNLVFLELRERHVTQRGVWIWATRRRIVEQGVDYADLFCRFLEARRRIYGPYLRTDGRFAARIASFLLHVRSGREIERATVVAMARASPLLLQSPGRGPGRSWRAGV